MSNIKRLRSYGHINEYTSGYGGRSERYKDITETLYFDGEVVFEEFEEGGRWSNYLTKVYKIEEDGTVAFFMVVEEVPATESQDGMECDFQFFEVEPYEVTVTKYRTKGIPIV